MPKEKPLEKRKCQPCSDKTGRLSTDDIAQLCAQVGQWQVSTDGTRIRREWKARNFTAAIDFFRRIAKIANRQDHHPDLHLEEYRNVAVELWTHAVGGLTVNDFIMAARIDRMKIALQKPKKDKSAKE